MAALALIGGTSILIGRGISAQSPGAAREQGAATEAHGPREKSDPPEKPPAKAGQPPEQASDPSGRRKHADTRFPRISIELAVAGLGSRGCEVEIKPANAACRFRPSPTKHVAPDGYARMEIQDVELRGADRTCTLAITIREPGQPPHTIYRGFRPGSSKPGTIPSFNCYVSSTVAGVDTRTTRK